MAMIAMATAKTAPVLVLWKQEEHNISHTKKEVYKCVLQIYPNFSSPTVALSIIIMLCTL